MLPILRRILAPARDSANHPVLEVTPIAAYDDYVRYTGAMREEYHWRRTQEQGLIGNGTYFVVPGYCFVCRRRTRFGVSFEHSFEVDGKRTPNWREHLVCPRCGLNNRLRASLHLFEQECRPNPTDALYITEQATPFFSRLQTKYANLTGSEYLGESVPFGKTNGAGIRNESLTGLTFETAQFDYILSFEVFEHIPDYVRALGECLRCLRPGGKLFFSVPFTKKRETTVRAHLDPDGTLVHTLPPEYHGDPLNSAGCLCFYHFGWQLFDDLKRLGFENPAALFYWSREFGYLGEGDQLLLTTQKPV
jgi:SAM-dependent methyltransferase